MQLWFFKHVGIHDGMNRVAATPLDASEPSAYGGKEPAIEFDGRKFERQLTSFISALQRARLSNETNS